MDSEKPQLAKRKARQAPVWALIVAAAMGPVTIFGGYWLLGGFKSRSVAQANSTDPATDRDEATEATMPSDGEETPPAQIAENTEEPSRFIAPDPMPSEPQLPVASEPLSSSTTIQDALLPEIGSLDELANVPPVAVPAALRVGQRFQPIKAGSFLLIQYVDGAWSRSAGMPLESPDATTLTPAVGRLMFFPVQENGKVSPAVIVPSGTRNVPFLWKVPQDFNEWRLGMDDQIATAGDNVGEARYRMALMPRDASPADAEPSLIPFPQPPRAKAPEKSEQLAARAEVRRVFRSDFAAAKLPSEKRALADKLAKQAPMTPDLAMRYVLWDEARPLALESGGLDLALSIISQQAAVFDVDPLPEQAAALGMIQKEIKTPKDAQKLEKYYDQTITAFSTAHRYEEAEKLVDELSALGLRVRDVPFRTRASHRLEQIDVKKKDWENGVAVETLLAQGPKFPKEHVLVGKSLAFERGQWRAGLMHLARGDEAELSSLAENDLAAPQDPAEQVALGDRWQTYAETLADSPQKTAVLRRAADWLLRAEQQLQGQERDQVTQKLNELNEIDVLLNHLIDPNVVLKQGDWKMENGTLISPIGPWSRIQPHYVPKGEYHVSLEVEWLAEQSTPDMGRGAVFVGLCHKNRQFMAVVNWEDYATGLIDLDGFFSWSPLTSYCHFSPRVLKRGQKNLIDIFVRGNGVSIVVNGKQLVHYGESYDRLQLGGWVTGMHTDKLFLGTQFASYRFSKIEVGRIPPELP